MNTQFQKSVLNMEQLILSTSTILVEVNINVMKMVILLIKINQFIYIKINKLSSF
jgi:hypothetical protein